MPVSWDRDARRNVPRGPRGVVPTIDGESLLKRGTEAFDALKLGMRDIEFLLDPGIGEASVGADMSYIAGGFMSAIIQFVSRRHPRLAVLFDESIVMAANASAQHTWMSAFGPKRTCEWKLKMSAFSGKADSARTCRHMRI